MKTFHLNNFQWEYLIEKIDFTDTEKLIISFLRRGMIYEEIALETFMSVSSVRRKVSSINEKIVDFVTNSIIFLQKK